jgi:ribonuclease VapC
MFVDASALVAMLLDEAEGDRIAAALDSTESHVTSPVAIFETVAALMRSKGCSRSVGEQWVRAALTAAKIAVVPITEEIGRVALDAFDRYGKGRRHPAQLNMGDCFAFACARVHGMALLYKGNDFARTELG